MPDSAPTPGFASPQGTLEYAERRKSMEYRLLGQTGLMISSAGFGGYRIDLSVKSHAQALERALLSGINLIDTSANYADGGSERLIGAVLRQLAASGQLPREQVVVISKAGYLQGENYRLSQERKTAGQTFPELVVLGEDLEHCIHPDFLSDQISRSLERLQLKCLDCLLLHNPEYYLKWARSQEQPIAAARNEYYRRIQQAFAHLESEVSAGRIRSYGISSNTFPGSSREAAFTSLATVWNIAESLSPHHSFRVIEFPMNLLETGAMLEKNQPGGKTLMEFAIAKKLGVLINRPLNAIVGERLVRLAETHYAGEGVRQARNFRDKAATLDADWAAAPNLSQLAIRALRSTEGVSAVLTGMRDVAYVNDVLEELARPCAVRTRKESWRKLEQL